MKFINFVIDEKIKVYKQTKSSIIDSLKSFQFPFYENNKLIDFNENKSIQSEYNYLLNMSIYHFTLEKINEIQNKITNKSNELNELKNISIKDMWIHELNIFEDQYKKFITLNI